MTLITKTPGVYVQEVSIFPPSVTSVATAIPAFIGYTENAVDEPKRITSMNEFVEIFGGPSAYWKTDGTTDDAPTAISGAKNFMLYYSMQMYFANGGGPCYVVSAGDYATVTVAIGNYTTASTGAFAKLLLEDEPTLIVMPDARLLTESVSYDAYKAALTQCATLQDRFTIIDIFDDVADFRTDIGTQNLKYGAAYYPDLVTSLSIPLEAIKFGTGIPADPTVAEKVAAQDVAWLNAEKNVRAGIAKMQITVPPSGAIAGVYASVDRSRGVWKAPANISLNMVTKPSITITNDVQDDLNVPTNGKAVNAIRSFTGKGTLVWGARTLAGNDNEWRYVSVRRLFIMIEESIRKATEWVVFEPNDANTWLKVKTMVENYLFNLWKDGAMAGAVPKDAYFVKVGLNQTMTAQDILEGKLIVEVGLAAVRPAEFVILKFSHKLQES